MTVKKKIQMTAVLSMGFAIVVGLFLYWTMSKVNQETQKSLLANELVRGLAELNIVTYEYLLHQEEWAITQWQSKYDSLRGLLKTIQIEGQEGKGLTAIIRPHLESIKIIFAQITSNYKKMERLREEKPILFQGLQDRLTSQLLVESQETVSFASQFHQQTQATIEKIHRKVILLVAGVAVMLGILISAISFFISRGLVRSIDKLRKGAEIIGSGNLEFRVGLDVNDEIGQLSKTFDQMTENLKAITVSRDKLEEEIIERKQAEEALIKSETFLNATGQIAKVGGWQIDGETKKVFWTKEIYNITEVPNDYDPSSLGKEAIVFFSAEDQIRLEKAIQRAFEHNEPYDMEFQITTAKGNKKWVQAICKPVTVDGKIVKLTGTFQNITYRKQAEEQIKASLKEKEVLLSEIHHRVKNNMQVIISLLNLQAAKIEDKMYADMLQESQNRILSMALVHEQLYLSKDFANIDFGEYVKSFVNSLFVSYGVDTNKIKLNIEIKDVSFDLENAIPCGLIINELVSNSLKHAFPQQREGNISIVLQSTNEDDLELTVSDDGVGIPEDLDIEQTDTMGLQLVRILAEQTLEGKMELNRTEGTQFHFLLKKAKYKPRI